jgi:hypothetical protein
MLRNDFLEAEVKYPRGECILFQLELKGAILLVAISLKHSLLLSSARGLCNIK